MARAKVVGMAEARSTALCHGWWMLHPGSLEPATIDGLTFHWMFCWSFGDRITQIHPRHVITRWKPVIAMVKGTYKDRLDRYMPDWIDSPFEEDRHHEWGQSRMALR